MILIKKRNPQVKQLKGENKHRINSDKIEINIILRYLIINGGALLWVHKVSFLSSALISICMRSAVLDKIFRYVCIVETVSSRYNTYIDYTHYINATRHELIKDRV